MTPADRIDELLRAELRRADDLVVSDRYAAVVARSAQRTRRRRAGVLAASLAVVIGTLGAVTAAVDHLGHDDALKPAVPVEQQLRGTWSRTINGQRWTVTFASGAVLEIEAPADTGEETDGASYATTSSTLRLDAFVNGSCYELAPGSYRWTLTGSTVLQLQADDEPCQARREIFGGAWTARP